MIADRQHEAGAIEHSDPYVRMNTFLSVIGDVVLIVIAIAILSLKPKH